MWFYCLIFMLILSYFLLLFPSHLVSKKCILCPSPQKNIFRTFLWSFLGNCAMFYIFFTLHLITFGEYLYYGLLWFNSYGKVKILNKIMKLWFYVYKDNESHLRDIYFIFYGPISVLIITTGSIALFMTASNTPTSTQTKGISTRHIWFILFDWIDYESIYYYYFLFIFNIFPSIAGIPLKENMKNKKKTWHNNTASDKIYLYTQQKKNKYETEIHSICLIKSKVRKKTTQNLSSNLFRFWYANYQCV